MIRKEQEGIIWLEFELLNQFRDLAHGVFLRHGGFSSSPYSSLNISDLNGDDPEAVEKNRQAIAAIMNCRDYTLPLLKHGNRVIIVSDKRHDFPVADGLITQQPGKGLLVSHADCQVAIFYDPVHHALANVHAGWRGNVCNIYAAAIRSMNKNFGTKPADLFVGISPSLCPETAEFIHYQTEFPRSFWDFQVKPNYFNLWEISRCQLEQEGVLAHHIEIAELSTFLNPIDFFSFRRDRLTGRHGTFAALQKTS